jgi:hypothetical protein
MSDDEALKVDPFEVPEWHDAIIKEIVVDRGSPGHRDRIFITVEWENETTVVEFFECWLFEARMKFGVIAPERILGARLRPDYEGLSELRTVWPAPLPDLKCYEFEMSSTGSMLWICAEGFRQHPAETEFS